MLNQVFNKYLKNFVHLLPYLILQLLFNVTLVKFFLWLIPAAKLNHINMVSGGINLNLTSSNIHSTGSYALLLVVIMLVTAPLFGSFIGLLSRNILEDKEINQIELLSESLKYYWRYVGLVLVMFLIGVAVFIAALILSLIPVLGVLGLICLVLFVIYLFTILTPCLEYLLYDNLKIEDAFERGKETGKNNFWKIFLLVLAIQVLSKIFNTDHIQSIFIISVITFITQAIDIFKRMYVMALCKEHKENKNISIKNSGQEE